MLRSIAAPIAAEVRANLSKGASAFGRAAVWAAAIVGLLAVGLGFLLAAAFMGLSSQLGPVLASVVLGLGLIVLALLMMAVGRSRAPEAAPPEPQAPPPADQPVTPLGQVAFVLGFVAVRALLRRLD